MLIEKFFARIDEVGLAAIFLCVCLLVGWYENHDAWRGAEAARAVLDNR